MLEEWDGRGTWRKLEYDDQTRPVAITENGAITEQLAYGDAALGERNQCGRLIRHDDPAGTLLFNDYGLTGAVLEQERRLTAGATAGFVTRMRMSPLGNLQSQTDAQANEQRFSHSLDGELAAVDLRLGGTTQWLPMVGAIARNAAGQVETQVAGNGVVTLLEYDAENGRLRRLLSRLGQQAPLQDQRFEYDALGNVLSIEEAALPIRYFANQRIEPTRRFVYDTLSQLIKATGFEALTSTHGPLSERSGSLANYCQTYRYDEGNNLLELTHVGAQSPGHRLVADVRSNRCLPVREGVEPSEEDFRNGFDGNGNLLSLQPGQALHWNLRNQLSEVRTVVRNDRAERADDNECYSYDAAGKRVRKLRSLLSKSQTNFIETLYLPGLEIRTHSGTGENLQVIDVQTGRGSVRVLHWVTKRPEQLANNQQRFSLTDHLGSITLELDQDASIISREAYYPFGGTAWVDGDAVQVSYKTVRYSGKERDATGLYYYGFRYYLPEWQRWLNPDPAGAVDGLNFYSMVRNNPIGSRDTDGRVSIPAKLATMVGSVKEMEIEVNTFNMFFFKTQLPKKEVSTFDASSGEYKRSDNFEVVEIGVGSRQEQRVRQEPGYMDTDELKAVLEDYRQKYSDLAKSPAVTKAKDAAKQIWNFKAGAYVSTHMADSVNQSEGIRELDLMLAKRPDTRLFALLEKTDRDKEPGDRNVYGVTMMTLAFPSENNDAELTVNFTVINPGSQLTAEQLQKLDDPLGAAKNTASLKGAGTYLTMNALNQVSETVHLTKIKTQAINPRSQAMALGWGDPRPY
ncbi:RHS repeat-associated core domain-containing protein [Pseudomonas sp. SWRI99]|uniref:RHS repeat domain-containing protein n=1 Tax=Pseudomonas sp. SWRI99 TaxID=2745506 RepID=UPI0016463A77|nr:RHS repeat-associated core domain-containing protein [Pseudomonas sp. SWRI99]MBC3775327.1 RHS repeat-associated core domain-containing protein [Pseudomonas sp. SWRI99]